MAAAEQSPWDMTPARRPSFESLGANAEGKFVIEEELGDKAPLKDGTMLYKDMVNRCLEAAAIANALVPSLRVTVRFSGGAPVLDSFMAPRTTLRSSDIKFTDNGDGDTTVWVDSSLIPPKVSDPSHDVHEGTKPTSKVEDYVAVGKRGARVKTWDNGSAVDLRFTVTIF